MPKFTTTLTLSVDGHEANVPIEIVYSHHRATRDSDSGPGEPEHCQASVSHGGGWRAVETAIDELIAAAALDYHREQAAADDDARADMAREDRS